MVTVFARYAVQDDEIYQIDTSWSMGLEASGLLGDDDRAGLAYGAVEIGDAYKAANAGVAHESEISVEAYYSVKVNDGLSISPHVQWVDNPGGVDMDGAAGDKGDLSVYSMRAQMSF
jgi:carbohydrate-selective porin OprB